MDAAEQPPHAPEHDNFEIGQEIVEYGEYQSPYTRGSPHPDPLIQSNALASVEPPPITYDLTLRPKIFNENLLSRPQLETVAYACQIHETMLPDKIRRRGFFLGDGAGIGTSHAFIFYNLYSSHTLLLFSSGVGKGRQIAALFVENWEKGIKKGIWLSASRDLKHDARRDLDNIGAKDIPSESLGDYPDIRIKEGMVISPNPPTHPLDPSLIQLCKHFLSRCVVCDVSYANQS